MLGKLFNKNVKIKKITEGEIVLLLDIRSSGIGAGIIKNFKGRGKAPLILQTCRNNIYFEDKVKPKDFVDRSKINLKKTLEEIINKENFYGKIDKVRVFYGSPWYKSFINNIEKQGESEIKLDSNYLKKIVEQHEKPKTNDESEIRTIEKKIMSVKMNGYKTQKPLDKCFKNLNISFYESVVHSNTQKEIHNIIYEQVKTKDIRFHTHPYVIFKVLSEKFEKKETYTIVDMSGEITEVVSVRDGSFEKLISIPKGSNYIVRELANKFNQNFQESLSKINMLLDNEIDLEVNEKYHQAYLDTKREWLNVVRELTTEHKINSLPTDVFLLVDKNYKTLILDLLNDVEGYSSSFMFGRKPNISSIDADSVINLVTYKNNIKKDPLISMEAGFLEIVE